MKFKNELLQQQFDKNGYLVMDFLTINEIDLLANAYKNFDIQPVAEFQVSNYVKNPELNKNIDEAIKSVIGEKISNLIEDYRLLTAYYYIKFPSETSAFYIHKDWNIVDETKDTSMHIWIPLAETTKYNGNLFFCPYDSNKKNTLRGSPGFEHPKPNFITNTINKYYQKDIYTQKGQAIFFKHNMTHGSRTNSSKDIRVAAGISIIPKNVQMVHYHKNKDGKIEKYLVEDDFYIDFNLETLSKSN